MHDPSFDVVGVGINSVDHVVVLPEFPAAQGALSKMRLRRYETRCGGQTATAMAACAALGLRAAYVGAVGSDANGKQVRARLADAGVDGSHVSVHDAATRFAVILIDERSGERAVLWDFDERLKLGDAELPTAALCSARLVHVDDVDVRAAIAAAGIARAHGVPVTSDIDQATEHTRQLVGVVTAAIFAEHVPQQLTGQAVLRDALHALPRRPDQVFVVTLGERGAVALDADGFHEQRGYPVCAVDTTGAGDVFRAGFIHARLAGKGLDDQLRYGNAAAALACTRRGAIDSVPTLEEVERLVGR